jgi:acyl dehydratase
MARNNSRQKDAPGLGSLVGRDLGEWVAQYDERDAILYALAVGARETELELVYEDRLQVLPTFALTHGLWAVEAAGRVGGYDRTNTLHVGQELTMRDQLPPRGEIRSHACIEEVWDKGSAALLVIGVSADAFDARYTIYLPGHGGFGGERGSTERIELPDRPPDLNEVVATREDQAALYRLTGDRHPVHIDPEIAAVAGFERPLLHGLATLGAVSLALFRGYERQPWDLREIGARFGAPVLPGDTIDVSGWRDGDRVLFSAGVGDDEVLSAGSMR